MSSGKDACEFGVRKGRERGREVCGTRTYSKRTLEGDEVLLDTFNCSVRNHSAAVFEHRRDVYWLPFDGDFGCCEDVFDSLGDLGTDSVAFD